MSTRPFQPRSPLSFFWRLSFWLMFATFSARLEKLDRPGTGMDMYITPPLIAQIAISGGDKFLAANIAVFRSLIAQPYGGNEKNYATQAIIQSDASRLNPAHEDNYYVAAAMLPWHDQTQAAQSILFSASQARPFDWMPPFFYAFNQYHFLQDPIGGAEWMRIASTHTEDVDNQIWLNKISATWISRGVNRENSYHLLLGMASEAHHKSLKKEILKRAEQLHNLIELDQASKEFLVEHGHYPASINDLLATKIIPKDPFNAEYFIDPFGRTQIKSKSKK